MTSLAASCLVAALALGQRTGLTPLTDPAGGAYKGFDLGLFLGGPPPPPPFASPGPDPTPDELDCAEGG